MGGETAKQGIFMIVRSLRQHFPARFPEWWSGGILTLWGLYLLNHPGLFLDPRIKDLFSGMIVVANFWGMGQPSVAWGVTAFSVGLVRLMALFVNGLHTRTPLIRLGTSFASAFIWTQVYLGLYKSGVPNLGLVVYGGLVFSDLCSSYRAGIDVTWAERHRAELARRARSGSIIA